MVVINQIINQLGTNILFLHSPCRASPLILGTTSISTSTSARSSLAASEQPDEMARATSKRQQQQQSKGTGKGRQRSAMQFALGKKGAAAKAKKSQGGKQEQPPQPRKGTQMKKTEQKEKAPATPRRSARKTATTGARGGARGGGGRTRTRTAKIAKPSTTEKRGQGHKSVQDLVRQRGRPVDAHIDVLLIYHRPTHPNRCRMWRRWRRRWACGCPRARRRSGR